MCVSVFKKIFFLNNNNYYIYLFIFYYMGYGYAILSCMIFFRSRKLYYITNVMLV